jgi:DnaJ-domain-containing protein 1
MSDSEQIGRVRGKPMSELSDSELQTELRRRRAKRNGGARLSDDAVTPRRSPVRSRASQGRPKVKQYLANLGLRMDAGLEEIKKAYTDLTAKYDPEKFEGDTAKQSTAQQLTDELSQAYKGLIDAFGSGGAKDADSGTEPPADD